jgi:hypothetical protein
MGMDGQRHWMSKKQKQSTEKRGNKMKTKVLITAAAMVLMVAATALAFPNPDNAFMETSTDEAYFINDTDVPNNLSVELPQSYGEGYNQGDSEILLETSPSLGPNATFSGQQYQA